MRRCSGFRIPKTPMPVAESQTSMLLYFMKGKSLRRFPSESRLRRGLCAVSGDIARIDLHGLIPLPRAVISFGASYDTGYRLRDIHHRGQSC